jgi:hypothetical protein
MKFEHCKPNGTCVMLQKAQFSVLLWPWTYDPKINRGHVFDMAVHPIKFYSCRLINAQVTSENRFQFSGNSDLDIWLCDQKN